ncbi:hypothetical protein JX266_003669 [Neoarthrinium moseri]|nr:hypothetical protein JX266_003669 [Neoarthrinium moseri]
MDQVASICLAFPPEHLRDDDDSAYHKAMESQLTQLSKLLKDPSQPLRTDGLALLSLLDPSVNSLSYLAVIHSLCIPGLAGPREQLLERLVVFLLSFDARQLRYAGAHLLDILNVVGQGQLLPPAVAVNVLAAAILRIDPSGSMLTSTHINLVKLAYTTDNIEPALPVIDNSIVFYPGMANHKTPDLLCDLTLSPPSFISKDSGLTSLLKAPAILEYDLLCGMMYCARRDWAKAVAAFERVISYPTRDMGTSKIMADAYKKWVLVSLLHAGKYTALPSYTGAGAVKAYGAIGKLYKDVATIFETENAADLKAEVDEHTKEWLDDGNTGLIGEVLSAYQQWQIVNLRRVYSKISIPEIRQLTKCAQIGDVLTKDEDVETLIQNMIISGTLSGVIEKNDNGVSFLTFLSSSATLPEVDFAREIANTATRLKALQPVFKATTERLGTTKEYIKHLVKEQRRAGDKDGDITMGFGADIEDEDLMGEGPTAEALF